MNKTHILPAVIMVFASVVSSAGAGEAARLCQFDQLKIVTRPTPAQSKVMEGIVANLDLKIRAWDIAGRATQRDLEAQLDRARKERNMATMTTILNTQRALKAQRADLVKPAMAGLISQLDGKQRAAWEGRVLFEEMHQRFKRFQLDAGQVTEIRSKCNEAGKTLAELQMGGKGVELAKVKSTLEREIAQNVLTDSQRQMYTGTSGRQRGIEGAQETAAERAERIRLAAMGFVGRRLAEDAARSKKAAENAAKTADEQLGAQRTSRPDTKNKNKNNNNRNKNNRNKNNRNKNNNKNKRK